MSVFLILLGRSIPYANIALWTPCLSHAAQRKQRRWFVLFLLCAVVVYVAIEFSGNPEQSLSFMSPGANVVEEPASQLRDLLVFVSSILYAMLPIVALVYRYRVRLEKIATIATKDVQTAVSDDDFMVERIDGAGAFRLPTPGWLKRR